MVEPADEKVNRVADDIDPYWVAFAQSIKIDEGPCTCYECGSLCLQDPPCQNFLLVFGEQLMSQVGACFWPEIQERVQFLC
mmetsp:Transcript_48181/g.92107  ORF Transcript_48181/g.92107 Transcript_48181/m.92107 type:complete len:81 (+) Transcript_48181:634-876(+)